jgi:hypothetical protein
MAPKRRWTDESTILVMGVSSYVDGGFGHGWGKAKLEFRRLAGRSLIDFREKYINSYGIKQLWPNASKPMSYRPLNALWMHIF